MLKACLLLLLIIPVCAFCQPTAYLTFNRNTKIIDSICNKIECDTTLLNVHLEFSKDDSSGFVADGNCYIDKPKQEIRKFVYKGYEDGLTIKTFYYYNKAVVKVIDDTQVYYYTDRFRDKEGADLPAVLAQGLIGIAGLVDDLPKTLKRHL